MPRIIFNRKVSSQYYRMRILCSKIASSAKPGQFIMVRVTNLLDPLLRRPFGIHRLCHESDHHKEKGHPTCMEILYRIEIERISHSNVKYIISRRNRDAPKLHANFFW